ncbi:MAG: CHASE3 domain-containing protein [Nitrospiraceae bacterium]|nr:CHASE3 domain-containing protein [Nitrospiraceae bacterium]
MYPRSFWFLPAMTAVLILFLLGHVTLFGQWKSRSNAQLKRALIIEQILRLERLVVEVETSFRGYLLAGQKTFLEPLQSAEAQLTSITDRLMMLTAGDQRLQGGIGLLHARVTEFVASKNRLTTIAENGQRDQVDLYVKVGDGRALFLTIDKAFKDFESRVDHEIPLEESDHEVWSWRTGWQLLLLDTAAVLTCFSVARAFAPTQPNSLSARS